MNCGTRAQNQTRFGMNPTLLIEERIFPLRGQVQMGRVGLLVV